MPNLTVFYWLHMNSIASNTNAGDPPGFDLFRLTKAKATVDLAPNTLRAYHAQGLPFYRRGKAVFVSKAELHAFIRGNQVH